MEQRASQIRVKDVLAGQMNTTARTPKGIGQHNKCPTPVKIMENLGSWGGRWHRDGIGMDGVGCAVTLCCKRLRHFLFDVKHVFRRFARRSILLSGFGYCNCALMDQGKRQEQRDCATTITPRLRLDGQLLNQSQNADTMSKK